MHVLPLLLLVAGSAAVAGAARRTPVPAPLLLVAVGLAVSYCPGCPHYELDPEIVLPLLLPPLLYTAATDSSYLDLRAQLRPVALLSVGYVLFATLVVGWAAYLIVPGLPLTAALVLGAVVAPPDAVAATAVARRVGLPSRITTILQGESLVNDATAITAYKVALAAAVGEGATWAGGIGEFLVAAVGGVARRSGADGADALAAHPPEGGAAPEHPLPADPVRRLRGSPSRSTPPGCSPWSSSRLYLGHRAWEVDFATRLQEEAVWKMVAFVLESAVFALIGLQLPVVLEGLGEYEGLRRRLVRRRRLPRRGRVPLRVGVPGDLPAADAVARASGNGRTTPPGRGRSSSPGPACGASSRWPSPSPSRSR